ncbi:hypothetical protein C5748_07590 [Phyllobacterium phragmitis]|uniref:Uncharacterized protein n=1 Tax=Phyllobacterium phragmitis TaxID=2670329 RepID=A0A2S9IV65_9HYPH|nr:hypothetical protein [Phyllobacterium phragmitis]PRD44426.1 hypothetical protein C5748_07590 [Phyllobacterium phragmitis]
MVDPLDPNLQPGRQNRPDDPVQEPPRPVRRSMSNAYLIAAVLLVILLIAGYYLYSGGDTANAPAPPEPATPTTPAPG